jgi:glutamyl-tRNA synthetase
LNGEWIRRLPFDDLVERVRPFATARYGGSIDEELLRGAVRIGQERATTLAALVAQMDFLFVPDAEFAIAPESWDRVVATERVREILAAVRAHLADCEWNPDATDLRPVLDALGVKPRKGLPAVYAAIEGRHAGLPLFDGIVLLGRERSLARIDAALEALPPA